MGSTLDIGATLLPFIGYEGNIAFGRNLLDDSEPEQDRVYIHNNLLKWRGLISKFWGFPKIQDSVNINIETEEMSIDERKFRMPILVELNEKLESTLKFQFDSNVPSKSLVRNLISIDFKGYFVLVDECMNIKRLYGTETLDENGFCMLAGKGKKYTNMVNLDKNISYTVPELKQMLNLSD